jgi:hypothetical protein
MRARLLSLAAASLLAVGLVGWELSPRSPACPALEARALVFEGLENDVRWIASNGEKCRLRFAYGGHTDERSEIRYEISRSPSGGHAGVDDAGVFYDANPELRAEALGLIAHVPGRPPIKSVFIVRPRV